MLLYNILMNKLSVAERTDDFLCFLVLVQESLGSWVQRPSDTAPVYGELCEGGRGPRGRFRLLAPDLVKREAWSTLKRSRVKIVHGNFSFPLLLLLKHILTA